MRYFYNSKSDKFVYFRVSKKCEIFDKNIRACRFLEQTSPNKLTWIQNKIFFARKNFANDQNPRKNIEFSLHSLLFQRIGLFLGVFLAPKRRKYHKLL